MKSHGELGASFRGRRILQPFELGKVGAGAEALPRSGQHDAAHRFVRAGCLERIEQRLGELGVERIALLRTIHRQESYGAAVFDKQGHNEASLFRASSASATSRRMTSAAGMMSSISPALWPIST